MNRLISQLIQHEGVRGNYYQCTANKKTIGVGRNVDDHPFNADELKYLGRKDFTHVAMTLKEAEWLLVRDVDKCELQLLNSGVVEGLSGLTEARKAVCVNMVYNIGIRGFCKFKNMLKALNQSDFKKASLEMLDSKWAKQVGNRAVELSTQMYLGEFDD